MSRSVYVRLADDLKARVDDQAAATGASLSDTLSGLIDEGLRARGQHERTESLEHELHEETASIARMAQEMAELRLAAEALQAGLTAKTHRLEQARQAREGLEEILARPSVTRCKHCSRVLRLMDLARGVCPNPSCQRTGFDVLPGYGQRRPAEILGEALAFVSGIGLVAAFLKSLEDQASES